MKKIDIIKGLCEMGNTEGVGVFTTPNEGEITSFIKEMFGEDAQSIDGSIALEPNKDHIYSYGDVIGRRIADELILVDGNEIFIYEIED